jgi:preprotein translocase subunit SecF
MSKFFHIVDVSKERDFLSRGKLFVWIGVAFATCMTIGILIPGGVNWGIDFAGGMEMQVKFASPVKTEDIRKSLVDLGFSKHQVQQYGAAEDNEWLLRVERVSSLTPELIEKADKAIDAAIGVDATVEYNASEGDRFRVIVPVPAGSEADIVAQQRMLDEQQGKLASAVEEQAGLRLRRTQTNDGKESTADAIVRDEPYQGTVKYLVQLQGISDKVSKELTAKFGQAEVRRVDFVDATVAQELKTDGVVALFLSLALILVYVALRFDLFFAPGAVIALLHDPLGALAVFVIGRMEFDLPSVAALLTTIGYSISHTIVIYDRVRETMPPEPPGGLPYETVVKVVNKGVSDTLNRTINTTATTLFTTVGVWIFAGGSVRAFAACLTVGCVVGALSSLFMAPTIYLWFRKNFYKAPDPNEKKGLTREDRERGVV